MEDEKTKSFASRAERDSVAAAALNVDSSADETAAIPPVDGGRAPRSARIQRIGIGVVALLSALLIGVSAFSLAGGEPSDESDAAARKSAVVEQAVEADEEDAVASDEDASDASHEADDASADSVSANAQSDSVEQSESATVATVQQTPTSTNQAPVPQPQSPVDGDSAAHMVNVTVTVDSSIVGNPVSGSGSFSLSQGSTVYDALCLLTTPNGGPNYVRAIGGLAEFDHGSQSGWKYSVNGVDGTVSCGSYVLSDGDVVAWRYVTSLNG